MSFMTRLCAHPGCTFRIPQPARGRPPLRCPEHARRVMLMRRSEYARAHYVPRRCAAHRLCIEPTCPEIIAVPERGRPPLRCPEHAAIRAKQLNSKHCRKWYATHRAGRGEGAAA